MQRLTGMDASFLYLETPRVQMHVSFASILDISHMGGGYSFQKVVDHVAERALRHPVFRRRLVRVPFDLHHPLWVDDPDFDVNHHVRRVALPAPGGTEEFGAMVGRIVRIPFDQSRPMWEVWVIEGLSDGRVGLLLKCHHSAVDGVSGARLLMHLFDTSPAPPPLPAPPPRTPDRIPTKLELVADAIRSRLEQPSQVVKVLAQTVVNYSKLVEHRIATKHPIGGPLTQAPRTLFNRSISTHRNLAVARLPLPEIKAVKNALGVTVNDVLLAVVGGALRRYLMRHDALPETSLTAVCPVSVRTEDEMGEMNNKVSAMWAKLGTDVADPVARAKAIHEITLEAKEEHQAMGADTLQEWTELAAPRMFSMTVRLYCRMHLANLHRPFHNLVVSNIPGPRSPFYLAGAKVDSIYPVGPVMEGGGLNLTVLSYLDAVDFGFFVDSEIVPDAWDLVEDTKEAFTELTKAVAAMSDDSASQRA